jgi:hypothetical protein
LIAKKKLHRKWVNSDNLVARLRERVRTLIEARAIEAQAAFLVHFDPACWIHYYGDIHAYIFPTPEAQIPCFSLVQPFLASKTTHPTPSLPLLADGSLDPVGTMFQLPDLHLPISLPAILLGGGVVYLSARLVYALFFHPLARAGVPGPWYAALGDVWNEWEQMRLVQSRSIAKLMEKYGPVVRIGENRVSFLHLRMLCRSHSLSLGRLH